MARTQLYHATVPGGPSGLSFRIGDSTLFAPVEEEALYVVAPASLIITGPVAPGMAAFLAQTVIEPRLAALAGKERAA